jgi:hypothetical protein
LLRSADVPRQPAGHTIDSLAGVRRVCVLLSIASLCLFSASGASDSHAAASVRDDGARVASAPMLAAAQLATVMPANDIRHSVSAAFAVVPAASVVTALLWIATVMRRRRTERHLLDTHRPRTRAPPSRLRPLSFSL